MRERYPPGEVPVRGASGPLSPFPTPGREDVLGGPRVAGSGSRNEGGAYTRSYRRNRYRNAPSSTHGEDNTGRKSGASGKDVSQSNSASISVM